MISLIFDNATGVARLEITVPVKTGGDIPVRLTYTRPPGTLSGLALALCKAEGNDPVLAFTETWARESATVRTAVLDGADARLVDYLAGKVSQACVLELQQTLEGRELVAPNVPLTVQRQLTTGPTTGEGGPTYYTQGQVDALIAAAVAGLTPVVRRGEVALTAEEVDVEAEFTSAFANGTAWEFTQLVVGNEVDEEPESLTVATVTARTETGFRCRLLGAPSNSNSKLIYTCTKRP